MFIIGRTSVWKVVFFITLSHNPRTSSSMIHFSSFGFIFCISLCFNCISLFFLAREVKWRQKSYKKRTRDVETHRWSSTGDRKGTTLCTLALNPKLVPRKDLCFPRFSVEQPEIEQLQVLIKLQFFQVLVKILIPL
jgi:hypothetical protein